jgi:hypothetical protein
MAASQKIQEAERPCPRTDLFSSFLLILKISLFYLLDSLYGVGSFVSFYS